MKALVTGANGLIGANLVRVLVNEGAQVRALVRTTSDLTNLKDLPIELIYGDVAVNDGTLVAATEGMDVVFHAAMHFSYTGRTAEELETTAISGTENVLRAARTSKVKRTVVTSSSVVFGYSHNRTVSNEQSGVADYTGQAPYVVAKSRQDLHALQSARQLDVELVLVCPTMSIGPYGRTLGPSNGMIVAYLNDPWRFTFPGGCNIVSVRDVAYGHLLAARHGAAGERYILGSENLEWREVHQLISELSGVQSPGSELNHTLAYLASTAEEIRAWFAHSPALSTRHQAGMVGRYYWYSHQKAAGLGYQPRSARSALAEAISWLAASQHISREVRTTMRLHPDVYAARRMRVPERSS
jgi:dihydroflavonol-4-reductase